MPQRRSKSGLGPPTRAGQGVPLLACPAVQVRASGRQTC